MQCFCRERGIPIVRDEWLADSIERQEPQPLEAYDIVSDLAVEGKGIPWDKQDPGEEALESLSSEVWFPHHHELMRRNLHIPSCNYTVLSFCS